MESVTTLSSIPKEIALEICEEIRIANQKKFFLLSFSKMQCWGCWRFGKKEDEDGNIQGICALSDENNRGCGLVNKIYDKRYSN
ncbi:MAG: hypothetical protein ACFFD4_24680 [Candidatus Odinarchaeota archaeon]